MWRVQVVKGDQILTVDDPSLLRVLTAAVFGAQSRGWHDGGLGSQPESDHAELTANSYTSRARAAVL